MSDKEWFATSKTFKINQALVSRCVGCVHVCARACVLQRVGWAPLIQLNFIYVCPTATFSAVIIAQGHAGPSAVCTLSTRASTQPCVHVQVSVCMWRSTHVCPSWGRLTYVCARGHVHACVSLTVLYTKEDKNWLLCFLSQKVCLFLFLWFQSMGSRLWRKPD